MDLTAVRALSLERTARYREIEDTYTEADKMALRFAIVDLVVNGATLRQIGTTYKISPEEARQEYHRGLAMLNERSIDDALAMRDEVTARQKALILANLPKAKAGDLKAAMIVQKADDLLTSIWGLRSLKIDVPRRPGDAGIADSVEAYLASIIAEDARKPL